MRRLEAVTRREQSLHLFHLLGKILYNKRKTLAPSTVKLSTERLFCSGKGDPPNPSASAKDKKREQELDARLKNPPPIPSWLSDHKRPTSRVDVDVRYDSQFSCCRPFMTNNFRHFTPTPPSILVSSHFIFTRIIHNFAILSTNAVHYATG